MEDDSTDKHWRRVTVDGADITEHIAAMFDAIVGSLDWGSGFLDTETIESILIVADLVGFEDPGAARVDLPGFESWPGGDRTTYEDWLRKKAKAVTAWRAQVKAKAAAMRKDDE